MEQKAQVNLEYLLIIVGAVAVVTIVALYIKSSANQTIQTTQQQTKNTP